MVGSLGVAVGGRAGVFGGEVGNVVAVADGSVDGTTVDVGATSVTAIGIVGAAVGVGGTGVGVGGAGVGVGGTGVGVGVIGVTIEGTAVAVGGAGVAVGGLVGVIMGVGLRVGVDGLGRILLSPKIAAVATIANMPKPEAILMKTPVGPAMARPPVG